MKPYVILGGGGWLGVQISRHLLSASPLIRIVGLGRSPERVAPFALHRGIDDSRYEYHQVHLVEEPERARQLLESLQPEVIVNLAAQAEETASWTRSWQYFESNTTALARLVEAFIGVPWLRRWVQIGSASVYGAGGDAATEDCPLRPGTPYAVSKAAADSYLLSVGTARGFPVNILRPANLYGPGQQLHRIIPKTALCALTGRPLPLQGGGVARKFVLHAEDLGRAIQVVAEKGRPGRVYNVGPRDAVTIRTLVETICRKVGEPFERVVQLAPDRGNRDTQVMLDSSRITADLGWEQVVNLDKGLDDTIAWMKQHVDVLRNMPTDFTFRA